MQEDPISASRDTRTVDANWGIRMWSLSADTPEPGALTPPDSPRLRARMLGFLEGHPAVAHDGRIAALELMVAARRHVLGEPQHAGIQLFALQFHATAL